MGDGCGLTAWGHSRRMREGEKADVRLPQCCGMPMPVAPRQAAQLNKTNTMMLESMYCEQTGFAQAERWVDQQALAEGKIELLALAKLRDF